ncbi:MAG: DedA family protein [Candidatus Gracilibacteria bacterium]|jgi:membrane-associated protein
MENLNVIVELIQNYGYVIIGAIIFLECIGIPFPGESSLILGGVAASLGHLNLVGVIIVSMVAAVTGDNLGYLVGKKFGRKIIKKFEHFPLFHYKHIERAEKFYKKHGNKTVFIGRFIAIIRTYAAVFAGIFDMHYPTFFFYNLTGGIVWAITFGVFGYALGNNIPLLMSIVKDFNAMVLLLAVGFGIFTIVRAYYKKSGLQDTGVTSSLIEDPAEKPDRN